MLKKIVKKGPFFKICYAGILNKQDADTMLAVIKLNRQD